MLTRFEKKLKNRLDVELASATERVDFCKGLKDKVANAPLYRAEKTKAYKKTYFRQKLIHAIVAACLILTLAVGVPCTLKVSANVAAAKKLNCYVLSALLKVRIVADGKDSVVGITLENGVTISDSEMEVIQELNGAKLSAALPVLLKVYQDAGYFDENTDIVFTATSDDAEFATERAHGMSEKIQKYLKDNALESRVEVKCKTLSVSEFAKEHFGIEKPPEKLSGLKNEMMEGNLFDKGGKLDLMPNESDSSYTEDSEDGKAPDEVPQLPIETPELPDLPEISPPDSDLPSNPIVPPPQSKNLQD